MPEWLADSHRLCEGISRNAHGYFALQDADAFKDPLTEARFTVGGLLADLAHLLMSRSARPFTYQRLHELAELSPSTMAQYAAGHGFAYLQAALRLANVTSSSDVFEDFDTLLNERMPDRIRLEPISWASAEVSTLAALGADPAWGLLRDPESSAAEPGAEPDDASSVQPDTSRDARTDHGSTAPNGAPQDRDASVELCAEAEANDSLRNGSPRTGNLDGGSLDGGSPDGGSPDGGRPDGGSPDSGSPDSGRPGSGRPGSLSGGEAARPFSVGTGLDDATEQENKRKRERDGEGGAAESTSTSSPPDAEDQIPAKSSRLDL